MAAGRGRGRPKPKMEEPVILTLSDDEEDDKKVSDGMGEIKISSVF